MGSVAVVVPARQGSACCDTIYAVTSDSLQRFDSATPGSVTDVGLLTGLQLGETIRAIDFRPATGQLYGIGGTGRLYTIDTTTAAATQVGAPFVLADAANVSMDFNPVADRIRVVNRADENFSLNPDTGDVIGPDTNLAYDAADANAGADPGVLAIGYTNNFAGASGTTLYGIDKILDILVRQGGVDGVPSPNGGQLFTIGSLGVAPTGGRVGLDINAGNTAFALMEFGGQPQLFTIDLDRGDVDLVGNIGSPFVDIDIAVQPAQPNPTPPPSAAPSAFGNVNCTGGISSVDALLVLRSIAGLPVSQSEPCEDIDKDTLPNGELQGDVDCSIDVNAVDALKLLRYVAALSVAQNEPCPNIGT
ncbi:MAG TPA: DUF4394 domain-containing protein [Dehalococcoidia bacterium]|nr:DUF4394 domain-containing protein [Dehalococcoidia bacterium]